AGSAARDTTLWGQALGGGARRDSNAAADGYHSTDVGLAAGLDHLFTPELLGGVAASWLHAWARGLDGAGGQSTDLDSYQLTFYGTYRHGRAFLDGQLGAGWNQFGQNRGIPFLGETAAAHYDGQQYLAHALLGYDLPLRGAADLRVTPLLGLRWIDAHDGAYAESGAGAADLSVKDETLNSLTQELGLKTVWSLATGLGRVTPELTAEWVHDYTHGPIATSGVIGGETFAVSIPRIAADGARLRAGATLESSDRLSFRLEYDGELRSGYQSHTGLFKLLWKF
ncbi:MAG TPA: autotransporter outer membrane beta-barrel domain-containing protein, partial [Caulobacteraceae bacterium]|nr:autotransporter outer membrane beta-barrel domain-containing protein [Caulobacteraceae bacterium]